MTKHLIEASSSVASTDKFCVMIYPNGITEEGQEKNTDIPAYVNFLDKETWAQYIIAESKFTKTDFFAHESAETKPQRFNTRSRLYERRVEFAKNQGYGNVPGKPKDQWFKKPEEPKNVA